jgi:protein TonB
VVRRLQRRSQLLVWLAASVALHLTLLAVLPGSVEEHAPLSVQVLDVALLNSDMPPPVKAEPPQSSPRDVRPAPRPQQRAPGSQQPRFPPRAEKADGAEAKAPPAPPAPPARAKTSPDVPSQASPEAPSVPDAKAQVPRPDDAPEITPPAFNAAYLRNPAPRYPLIARRHGEQGTVTLRVLVTREGRPASVSVERTSGSGHLDSAALETVKTWRFVPARQGRESIEAWVLVPIVFRLEGTS